MILGLSLLLDYFLREIVFYLFQFYLLLVYLACKMFLG